MGPKRGGHHPPLEACLEGLEGFVASSVASLSQAILVEAILAQPILHCLCTGVHFRCCGLLKPAEREERRAPPWGLSMPARGARQQAAKGGRISNMRGHKHRTDRRIGNMRQQKQQTKSELAI